MSLKKSMGKVLILCCLEIGALMGVPMNPDEIQELMMRTADQQIACVVQREEGDGED
jgi:hypothetical protein